MGSNTINASLCAIFLVCQNAHMFLAADELISVEDTPGYHRYYVNQFAHFLSIFCHVTQGGTALELP